MPVVERTIGTVVANSTVSVNARVQGQLTKAYFKEGQMVKTGDLLFQIDPRPYQAAYDNALASLATAKAKADRYARLSAQNAIAGQQIRRCPGRLSGSQGRRGSRRASIWNSPTSARRSTARPARS